MIDRFGTLHSDFGDLELPNLNVWQFLYQRLEKWSDLTAFVTCSPDETLTYKELIRKSLCWAKALKKATNGVQAPTVAYVMSNNIDCFPLMLGSFAVGAAICPIREDYSKDLFYVTFMQTKPDILVIDSKAYKRFKPTLAASGVNPKIYIRGHCSEGNFPNIRDVINSDDLLSLHDAGQCDPKTVALRIFSSGTTGSPKCIVITHMALTNMVTTLMHESITSLQAADEGPQETVAGSLPLTHMFGIQYFAVLAPYLGCKVVCLDGNESEQDLLSYMIKHKPTLQMMRSYMLESMSHMDCAQAMTKLKVILFTGSPFSYHKTFQRLSEQLDHKLLLQDCYGCSEIGVVAMSPLSQSDGTQMTGKLLPNLKVRFRDFNTKEIIKKPFILGELFIKGPGIMKGYLNNPEATKNVIDADGWYHCGDTGFFDNDHFIKVTDRAVDLMSISLNGKKVKVSPSEIEGKIRQHPDVIDVGVTGVPDPSTGEEIPKAFVVRRGSVTENDIVKLIDETAPPEMKLTGGVDFVTDLPRNNLGKLLRKFLREKAWFIGS